MQWYLDLHETKSMRFKRQERGKNTAIAVSPFSENEELTLRFKAWARVDLENLNILNARDFINDKLLKDWTAAQLKSNRISYPVSPYIVGRWMREAGFRYERYKKTYYVDKHEDPDVIKYCNTYLEESFSDELYEHCWIQLPKKLYLVQCLSKKLQNLGKHHSVKKQKTTLENVSNKISKYNKQVRSFEYNEDGREMIELHVDDVYACDNDEDKYLPKLPKFGGNLSVRFPDGAKPRLVLGQDEAIF